MVVSVLMRWRKKPLPSFLLLSFPVDYIDILKPMAQSDALVRAAEQETQEVEEKRHLISKQLKNKYESFQRKRGLNPEDATLTAKS